MPAAPVPTCHASRSRSPRTRQGLILAWRASLPWLKARRLPIPVSSARRDSHHKTALVLVRQYDTIYHEDLQTANMVRNHARAKSINDAGWGQFLAVLAFKAACAGKRAVAVPPAFTSQACSGCGVLVQKGLSVRWHLCPACGTSLQRDHNAALNILRSGTERSGLGQSPQASTWPAGASVA
ncbi:MAG TPA: transposase [Ktedonobacterales bacterium]|nr:transposase [Ktedonobacterales bacterium]